MTIGRFGGFYASWRQPNEWMSRICLGWIAVDVWWREVDDVLVSLLDRAGEAE
ncbi:MAG: hypothetical protein WC455_23340 [Dehalococcoidia bacterium]